MAKAAYPDDVPLFRYDYTALSLDQVAAALRAPALGGPGGAAELEQLTREELAFVATDGTRLTWNFGPDRQVTLQGEQPGRYGALTVDHITLIAHLVPGTTRGYAIAWDRHDNRATVFELWFGGGPAPTNREVNRAVWHGHIEGGARPEGELHMPTGRVQGRAIMWAEDTGNRTVDYYPSSAFSHWVELDRIAEGRGYSGPSDYIKLTEDLYLYTRTEAEFSGLWQMYVMDANRLQSVGLRLGFDGLDNLEYYMFRGTGEWLGQIANFMAFEDVSGDPLAMPDGPKGARRVYRPLETMDKMTPAEVSAAVAAETHVFARASAMAGHGLPPSRALSGRNFAVRYDGGPQVEYRFTGHDELQWREGGAGGWTTARYNAWETMPGVFIFGHLLAGKPNHDGHVVVADFDNGKATCFRGYLNTPYFANEAGAETWFGKLVGEGIPDPGTARHERTNDLLGSCLTWSYSPGLTSMHLYSSPNTVSWIIFTPSGHGGAQWSGSGDFVKIRDQLYFVRWQEEACNGTLGTILINLRTMHDSGIGYHCGENGLSMSPVGAYARLAGRFDVEKYLGNKRGGYAV
ncbi:molybdenum cofactor biosynthesis F family protein [Altererythrobacter sp. KTW20L]|uniref:MoaF N-terminal domain-containing protein n=1 Tax=Altererythrobacter sp. KTW20L TaxID=2942210 RepID=UPI0020BD763C|nr:MoaF N-terminal domain-containing protein [Altererythrobacter sp. KTW20L]MCL6249495.1 molybdenum cofactor biosynthesis F family protein [Altererythrobacter sp. KTW20L]